MKVVSLLLAALVLMGCTNTIRPPVEVSDPATVFLLDHGRHSSLLLPVEGGLVRYAYGDWRWYALGDTGAPQGLAALFGSTPAGLGRRLLPGDTPQQALAGLQVGVEQSHVLQVETAAVAQLRSELDRLHEAGEERVENPASDLEFATHPVPYSLRHNSNSVVGQWLEALGCEVEGPLIFARWRIIRK